MASNGMDNVKNFVFRSFTGPPQHSDEDEDYLDYAPNFSPKSAPSDEYIDYDDEQENFGFRSSKLGEASSNATVKGGKRTFGGLLGGGGLLAGGMGLAGGLAGGLIGIGGSAGGSSLRLFEVP